MKKVMALTLLGLCTLSAANAAEQGTISYVGEVTGGTCDVKVNGGTENGTVTLPTVTASDLNDQKEAGKTTFNFTFTHCAGTLKYVQPYFDAGSTVDTSSYYLKNVGGSATGVQLVLRTPGGSQIKPGTATQAGGTAWKSGADVTSGDYSVAYITNATIGPAVGGTVASSIIYHLEYY